MKALYPNIAAEFWTEDSIDPDTISPKSWIWAHWNCSQCGQKWASIVSQRISGAKKCPYCDGKMVIPRRTSFKALYPEIEEEFSSDNDRDSDTVFPTSSVYAVWNCRKCNQTWGSSISERVKGSASCPYCDGRKAIPGLTSLKALYPEIEEEFSSDNGRDSDTVLPTSSTYTVWNCRKCNQTWGSSISERVKGSTSCPYCDGRKAIPGRTSLAALYPELMSEWNEFANVFTVDPDKILPKSLVTTWWTCPRCSFKYTVRIKDRVRDVLRNRNSCPHCKGYRRVKHNII